MPDKNGNEIATMYVGHYGIEPQAEGEDNRTFRSRVADVLRSNNLIIDAHEAYTNRYHDEKQDDILDSPTTGIVGAVALAMQGKQDKDIGYDMAAGVCVQKKQHDPTSDDALVMLMMALGGR